MNKKLFSYETLEWREQVKALFFVDHLGVGEIAVVVQKARETVSRFITDCDGYDEEMEFRKERSNHYRREYQRQWDAANRAAMYDVTKDSLRREHETASKILSSEKY